MTDMTDDGDDQLRMFFPTVVQISKIDGAAALNRTLLKAIERIHKEEPNTKPKSWCCEVYTTIGSPKHLLEYPEFKEFGEIAYNKVMQYANALKFDTERFTPKINECWFNIYSKTHSQEIHVHQNSVVSGIYYVKAPSESAPTLLHSPMADVMLEPPTTERNILNNSIAAFDATEGQMILFRSSVRHSVLPSVIDEDRVTIAFNATM